MTAGSGDGNRLPTRAKPGNSGPSLFPFLLKLCADCYQGAKFQAGLQTAGRQISLEIVKRSCVVEFVILSRRWIAERTVSWLNGGCGLAKDGNA
jgi:hypothetical protein